MMEDAILTDIKIQIHKAMIENPKMEDMEWVVSQLLIGYLSDNCNYQKEDCFGGFPINIIKKDGFYANLVKLSHLGGGKIKSAFYNYSKKKNDVDNALDDVIEMLNDGDFIEINREKAIFRGTLREYIMADIDGKRGYFTPDELTGIDWEDENGVSR